MNYLPSYFEFSSEDFPNQEKEMTNQFNFQKSLDKTREIEQARNSNITHGEHVSTFSSIKRKKFSFLWTINNFKEFMDRQYEFTSPIFSENLLSGMSKWRMVIHPVNTYPEGANVSLRLLLLSEIEGSYSIMYTVSFFDNSGKHHMLKTREKVFRHSFDFDECTVISSINLKERDLFTGESLVIKCEFDLLECESLDGITYTPCKNVDSSISRPSGNLNSSISRPSGNLSRSISTPYGNLDSSISRLCGNLDSSVSRPCENVDSFINRSCENPDSTKHFGEKINIPSMVQSINDLSYSEPFKKPSDREKNVNTFIEKNTLPENNSGEFEASDYKIKGLEILSNDFKHLYYDTNQHDIVIYADDGKHTAHEIVVTSRSDYFKKALMSQKDKEINVPGINVDTLDAVLYYLYTGKLKHMTENSALHLLKASKILKLPCLENMTTETFLCSRISASNVTNVFLMAKELKIESLKNSALKFMAENQDKVMKTEQWNQFMRSDPHSAGEVLLTVAYYQTKVPNNACSI